MTRRIVSASSIQALLLPESALERQLLSVPEIQRGLLWGEPRFGHPEGAVVLHVREVLDNIDRIPDLDSLEREQLRLIGITHDAFKYAEDRSRPRDWSKHHGVLARKFLEQFTSQKSVLDVIETHDDAYYHWLAYAKNDQTRHIEKLFDRVGYCLRLYYLFFKCDTQTGDKTQASLRWFERQIDPQLLVKIRPYWPWERL